MIYLGADHRGYELKEQLKSYLNTEGYEVTDCGAYEYDSGDDYPDYGGRVARSVQGAPPCCGILLCGSGQGVCIAANRYRGVRAILAYAPEVVKEGVEHDHANVICLPADECDFEDVKQMADAFMQTDPLEDDKYDRRVQKLDELT
jgi:ribose 5-phosphate isomerase B